MFLTHGATAPSPRPFAITSPESSHFDFRPCRTKFVRFAYGLQKGICAVAAAVDTSWSTGQVEGQINRLNMIKRQCMIAMPDANYAQRFDLLLNMICLAKYATHMDHCVGTSHAKRPDGLIKLDMGYLEEPWAHDPLAGGFRAGRDLQ
jgi:hypothetical protein